MKKLLRTFILCYLAASVQSACAQQVDRELQRADARAKVLEQWEGDRREILLSVIGIKCALVENLAGNVAINNIMIQMNNQLIHAGLFGDPKMNLAASFHEYITDAKQAVDQSVCAKLVQEDRIWIRSVVNDHSH